jgi:hypothetical protein
VRRARIMPIQASAAAITIKPDRVKVRVIAYAISSNVMNTNAARPRRLSSRLATIRPTPSANTISRYIDAIVGYCSEPPARTSAPTLMTCGRNAFSH